MVLLGRRLTFNDSTLQYGLTLFISFDPDAEEARITAQRAQEDEERRARRGAAKKSNIRPLVPSISARGPSRTPATFRKEPVCVSLCDQL